MRRPSLLVVVQRYGDVSGGAEAHARELVRRLAPHLDITVATTTAADYWTWANVFQAGETRVDGVRVLRFPVVRRRARDFRRYERAAFATVHALDDERAFIEAQGPVAPDLLDHVFRHGREYDHALFFTYIYYPTVFGLPLVPECAVLVPTAHDEPALRLSTYRALFHAPRAIAFNTVEERELVHTTFHNERISNEIVGVGINVPDDASTDRFRERFGIAGPYVLYVGRIVQSKGCDELFDAWARWKAARPEVRATLVLAGSAEMAIPAREDVKHVGFLDERDKFDAYAGCAAFVMPSRLESLSLVTLEAWAMGRPVVCSAFSPVVASMAKRAGAGLPYDSHETFGESIEMLIEDPKLACALGEAGRDFVRSTYTWPRVVETYLDLFAEVRARNG